MFSLSLSSPNIIDELLPLHNLTWTWSHSIVDYAITPVPSHLGFLVTVYMVDKSERDSMTIFLCKNNS